MLEHEVEPSSPARRRRGGVDEAPSECDDVVVVESAEDAGLAEGGLADLLLLFCRVCEWFFVGCGKGEEREGGCWKKKRRRGPEGFLFFRV